jgi:hypothetical protein
MAVGGLRGIQSKVVSYGAKGGEGVSAMIGARGRGGVSPVFYLL